MGFKLETDDERSNSPLKLWNQHGAELFGCLYSWLRGKLFWYELTFRSLRTVLVRGTAGARGPMPHCTRVTGGVGRPFQPAARRERAAQRPRHGCYPSFGKDRPTLLPALFSLRWAATRLHSFRCK